MGREEDAADEYSAYEQLRRSKEAARHLIRGVAYLGRKQAQQVARLSCRLVG
jgi:hypothetical protein